MVNHQLKRMLAGVAAASMFFYAAQAAAETFLVNAAVNSACVVSVPDPLAFGAYDPVDDTALSAQTDMYVTCVDGTLYGIYLNAGLNSDSVLSRNMIGGTSSDLLGYELYTTSTLSGPVWGDGTVGTDYQCGTGTGLPQTYTIYGQVPAGQTSVVDDSYSDTVTVDVVF